jgi:dipeptidyl aminopeptidase/acylaminoacyl peptidase
VEDVSNGVRRGATRTAGLNSLLDVSRDGRWGTLSRLISRGNNDVFLVELATGKETLLTPHEGPGSFGGGIFSPDGRTVWLASNGGRDRIAFARVRLDASARPGPLEVVAARDDAELQEFEVDEAGTTAALAWNVAGRTELAFVDLASGRSSPGPALPAEIGGGLTFSKDGRQLALTISGAAAPNDVWVLDRTSGRLRQVTRSPHPGVALGSLVRPELVRFPASDGLELSGWLYRPAGRSGPGPIVLSFHGGPEAQERPSFRSDYQALLARGIAVLAPNVRGSAGFGKRFVNLDNGALRRDGVRDILACLDYVTGAGVADPKRIGIMGGSYGGYMVMAGLTEYPDRFAAGANLFGVVNFATFFAHTEPWMAAISKVEYGDPDKQADLLRELSPIHRVDRVKTPTIVLHGANDTNVPVVEAEQVVDSLRGRSVPVEYVLFPDEGHGFRKTPNRIRSTVAIVRWFEQYLGR